jgi:hypothetical protein
MDKKQSAYEANLELSGRLDDNEIKGNPSSNMNTAEANMKMKDDFYHTSHTDLTPTAMQSNTAVIEVNSDEQ